MKQTEVTHDPVTENNFVNWEENISVLIRKYFKVLASPDSSFAGPRGSDDESVCLVPAGERPRQRHRHQRPAGGVGQQAGQQRLGYHFI